MAVIPTGEILLVSNEQERKIYVNIPPLEEAKEVKAFTQIYDLSGKDVPDTILSVMIDKMETSDDFETFYKTYLKDIKPQLVEVMPLFEKLTEIVDKKIPGIYAYQPFRMVIRNV